MKDMILPILRSVYDDLTKSEKKIAQYISVHAPDIMGQTVAELARNTDSSEITISRFCKKLGFSGLQGLKIALAAELSAAGEDGFQDIHRGDTEGEIAGKIFRNITDGLQDTLKILDFNLIKRAVQMLAGARLVAIYGFGNSATVCRDLSTRFLRFGIAVQAFDDAHLQVTSAALLSPADVVVAVSHSGATKDILSSVAIAKNNGAKVIAITSYAQSELARSADIALVGMGREVRYRSEAAASRLVHMAIGDILYTCLALSMPEQYGENLQKMRKVIAERRL
ncbi:MAG: MurR/RpiR family transcriptional regulator [Selenomonas sp.]|jgi:DNA-binding MurR/RpiR family transcriptional regulator|nr:MurR/RpiR family transcriptional regulator [Selenomonas sp.]MBQ1615053.1 MurR/RpiR family transcriptional regulator [Selenomonas sp.]MBQ2137130.1 MurR/RpiR family transcriptional regulator [Selenomonas sp.]MBQ4211777.1 MurR/RpiR family transcriptional regulator [Selenomonas sp.]MBQ5418628.1 MurR/RpiR family transcriptional regulator [Selenomonas sp.]